MLVQRFSPFSSTTDLRGIERRLEPGARRVAFVDRDGVINVNRPNGVRSWSELALIPAALDGLALFARLGWTVVVVTNQALINRGMLSETTLFDLHERMVSAIRERGGDVAAVYACPHRPDERCGCRKPAPGLLNEAARQLVVDLNQCVFVGDHWTDLEAARAAGCPFILVLSGRVARPALAGRSDVGEAVASDLLGAARYVEARFTANKPELVAIGGGRC